MLLLNVLIALATFSTTLTATLFAIYQMEKRRRSTYAVKDGDVPVLEAQDRADAIVKNAAEKARTSLLAAEQEGVNLVNKYKQVQLEIGEKYGRQMDEIIKGQILQKEKEIQGRINQYFTVIEDSLKAYSGDLKERAREIQIPFDQIKAELTQKIMDTEKLYTDYIKSLEEKVNVSLIKNQSALDETRKTVETKYLEAESNYNDFLVKSEMKLAVNLEKNQGYLETLKSGLESKGLEAQSAYNDYLANLKIKVEEGFTKNRKDLEEMKANLGTRISQTEESYAKFLKSLEDSMTTDFNKKQQALDVKVNEFFGQTQEMLGKFLKDLENRTQTQVEEEIGNAKKLIEEYKRQRLQIVDENLIAILEKTLNITLGKKLTLSDQTQLVYEALEEAKKENFFA